MRSTVFGSVLLVLVACGGAPARVETSASVSGSDPCRGAALTLERALASCRVAEAPPEPSADDMRVTADSVEVRSGEVARVWMTFENTTDVPLEIGFAHPPDFPTSIWRGTDRVDERFDVRGVLVGALRGCTGDCVPLAVTIAPHGSLRAYVDVEARLVVVTASENDATLVDSDGGPIAEGRYELEIVLPWSQAGDPDFPRTVRTPFVVTR